MRNDIRSNPIKFWTFYGFCLPFSRCSAWRVACTLGPVCGCGCVRMPKCWYKEHRTTAKQILVWFAIKTILRAIFVFLPDNDGRRESIRLLFRSPVRPSVRPVYLYRSPSIRIILLWKFVYIGPNRLGSRWIWWIRHIDAHAIHHACSDPKWFVSISNKSSYEIDKDDGKKIEFDFRHLDAGWDRK